MRMSELDIMAQAIDIIRGQAPARVHVPAGMVPYEYEFGCTVECELEYDIDEQTMRLERATINGADVTRMMHAYDVARDIEEQALCYYSVP